MTDCAYCGVQWMDRPDTSYKNLGSKSISFIHEMELLSKFGQQRVKLSFCDLHANNINSCTRITNKGVLKILNKSTGMWRSAGNVGKIVTR